VTRVRRSKEASRQAILEAAERLLLQDGPEGVRVQRVAAAVGVTDAAVHYHFGNREGLMEALLRHCGRRLIADVRAASVDGHDLAAVSRALQSAYLDRGAALLAVWLKLAGWRPPGSGMFSRLAEQAAAEGGADPQEAKRLIALLNAVHFAIAISGDPLLRALDLDSSQAGQRRFLAWATGLVAERLV
jgi:AcrR family transcriptional regulator